MKMDKENGKRKDREDDQAAASSDSDAHGQPKVNTFQGNTSIADPTVVDIAAITDTSSKPGTKAKKQKKSKEFQSQDLRKFYDIKPIPFATPSTTPDSKPTNKPRSVKKGSLDYFFSSSSTSSTRNIQTPVTTPSHTASRPVFAIPMVPEYAQQIQATTNSVDTPLSVNGGVYNQFSHGIPPPLPVFPEPAEFESTTTLEISPTTTVSVANPVSATFPVTDPQPSLPVFPEPAVTTILKVADKTSSQTVFSIDHNTIDSTTDQKVLVKKVSDSTDKPKSASATAKNEARHAPIPAPAPVGFVAPTLIPAPAPAPAPAPSTPTLTKTETDSLPYKDDVEVADKVIEECYGGTAAEMFEKEAPYRARIQSLLESESVTVHELKVALLDLLNWRNNVNNGASFSLDELSNLEAKNVDSLGLWKGWAALAIAPSSTASFDCLSQAKVLENVFSLTSREVRETLAGRYSVTRDSGNNNIVKYYYREIVMDRDAGLSLLMEFGKSRLNYSWKTEFVITEGLAMDSDTISIGYGGITTKSLPTRLQNAFTSKSEQFSLFRRFVELASEKKALKRLNLWQVNWAKLGDGMRADDGELVDGAEYYRGSQEDDEEDKVEEINLSVDGQEAPRLFNRLVDNPALDFMERFVIRVLGFASLNVDLGGMIHHAGISHDDGCDLRCGVDLFIDEMKSSFGHAINFRSNNDSNNINNIAAATAINTKINTIVDNYINKIHRLPIKKRGPDIKPQLAEIIKQQLQPQPNTIFDDGSVLSLRVADEIPLDSNKQPKDFWHKHAGQGPRLFKDVEAELQRIVVGYGEEFEPGPLFDIWMIQEHETVSMTAVGWVAPVIKALRPLVLNTISSKSLAFVSNLMLNYERVAIGCSKDLSVAKSLKEVDERFHEHFVEGKDLDKVHFVDEKGNLLLNPVDVEKRRREWESVDLNARESLKVTGENTPTTPGFIDMHVGVPKLVCYGLDAEEDVSIVVATVHPGHAKYLEPVRHSSLLKILYYASLMDRIVKKAVETFYPGFSEHMTKRDSLAEILITLKGLEAYQWIQSQLRDAKDSYLRVTRALRFLSDRSDKEGAVLNLNRDRGSYTMGRRTVLSIGWRNSNERRLQYVNLQSEIEFGNVSLRNSIDPTCSQPPERVRIVEEKNDINLGEHFFMNVVFEGRVVQQAVVNFGLRMKFAIRAKGDLKLMSQYDSAIRNGAPFDVKEEDLFSYNKPKSDSLSAAKKTDQSETSAIIKNRNIVNLLTDGTSVKVSKEGDKFKWYCYLYRKHELSSDPRVTAQMISNRQVAHGTLFVEISESDRHPHHWLKLGAGNVQHVPEEYLRLAFKVVYKQLGKQFMPNGKVQDVEEDTFSFMKLQYYNTPLEGEDFKAFRIVKSILEVHDAIKYGDGVDLGEDDGAGADSVEGMKEDGADSVEGMNEDGADSNKVGAGIEGEGSGDL